MAKIAAPMVKALNEQLNREIYSSNLYLAMAAYFEAQRLSGFGHWMRVQAEEEGLHVKRFFAHVVARGGRVLLEAIDAPPADWPSPIAVFSAALAHEEVVTGHIHDLVRLAVEERDRATESFLKFFVDEQVEEEAMFDQIIKSLHLSADSPASLLLIDRELATRPQPAPTPAP